MLYMKKIILLLSASYYIFAYAGGESVYKNGSAVGDLKLTKKLMRIQGRLSENEAFVKHFNQCKSIRSCGKKVKLLTSELLETKDGKLKYRMSVLVYSKNKAPRRKEVLLDAVSAVDAAVRPKRVLNSTPQ